LIYNAKFFRKMVRDYAGGNAGGFRIRRKCFRGAAKEIRANWLFDVNGELIVR